MFRQVWKLVPQNIDIWALFPISPPERLTLMPLLVATSVQSWVSSSLHRGEDKSMKSKNWRAGASPAPTKRYLRNTAGASQGGTRAPTIHGSGRPIGRMVGATFAVALALALLFAACDSPATAIEVAPA